MDLKDSVIFAVSALVLIVLIVASSWLFALLMLEVLSWIGESNG